MLLALAAEHVPTWRMSELLQRPEASLLKRLSILEGLRARDHKAKRPQSDSKTR